MTADEPPFGTDWSASFRRGTDAELRGWLDVNLPPLVERLVREEIERVSRGRR